MELSKTSKVWLSALGGGALAVGGGVLLVTGVGAGAGAVLITSGLAAIGSIVGGGMLAGIGVLGAGTATSAALAAAIGHRVIKDPELLELGKKLQRANELYQAAAQATATQKSEIEELNRQIGDLLRRGKKDRERMEDLNFRLMTLIRDMRGNKAA